MPVDELPQDHRYFRYQQQVNADGVPSEQVIQAHQRQYGEDYRSQIDGKHPVAAAQR